jgi:hypothetical protein
MHQDPVFFIFARFNYATSLCTPCLCGVLNSYHFHAWLRDPALFHNGGQTTPGVIAGIHKSFMQVNSHACPSSRCSLSASPVSVSTVFRACPMFARRWSVHNPVALCYRLQKKRYHAKICPYKREESTAASLAARFSMTWRSTLRGPTLHA